MYPLRKSTTYPGTTLTDLITLRTESDFEDKITLKDLSDPNVEQRKRVAFTESETCAKYKSAVAASASKYDEANDASTIDFKGDCMKMIHFLGDSEEVTDEMRAQFKSRMVHEYEQMLAKIANKRKKSDDMGKVGKNAGQLMAYGQRRQTCRNPKRLKSMGKI